MRTVRSGELPELKDERTVHVAFAGDFDVYRRDEFISSLPPPEGIERLVIDMREVGIIDSTFIAALMRYRRSFIDAGGDGVEIVVVAPPQLRRIFQITGLTKMLTIVTAEADSKEPLSEA
jgi:anti-anti-sigma factor